MFQYIAFLTSLSILCFGAEAQSSFSSSSNIGFDSKVEQSTSILIMPQSAILTGVSQASVSTQSMANSEVRISSIASASIMLKNREKQVDRIMAQRDFDDPNKEAIVRRYLLKRYDRMNDIYKSRHENRQEILDLVEETSLVEAALITFRKPDNIVDVFSMK